MLNIPFNPNEPQSIVPTLGTSVRLFGQINGEIQDYNVQLDEFAKKLHSVNKELFPNADCCDIIVQNTAFVMKNGNDITGVFQQFNHPFLTIQAGATATGPLGVGLNTCVVVYPGEYPESINLLENTMLFLHPGVTIVGDITVGNNCYVHFCSGAILQGNISDGGSVVTSAIIGGDGIITGQVFMSAINNHITISGHSWGGCIITGGAKITSYVKNLPTGQIDVQTLSTGVFHNLSTIGNGQQGVIIGDGDVSIYNSYIESSDIAIVPAGAGGVWVIKDCIIIGTNGSLVGNGADLKVINCTISGYGVDYSNGDLGTTEFYDCHITSDNTLGLPAIKIGASTARKTVFKNCYINATAVTGAANVDGIGIDNANVTLVIKGCTTIVAKGVGDSISAPVAVNVKVQFGSEANNAVGVNVTETVNSLFINAGVE